MESINAGRLVQVSFLATSEIKTGTIKTVLTDFEETSLSIHVIFREGRNGSAKVRSLVGLAVERLRSDKALQ